MVEVSSMRKEQIFVIQDVPCWNEPQKYKENMAKYPRMTTIHDENELVDDIKGHLVESCHKYIAQNIHQTAQFFHQFVTVLRLMDVDPESAKTDEINWVTVPESVDITSIRSPGTPVFVHGGVAAQKKKNVSKKHQKATGRTWKGDQTIPVPKKFTRAVAQKLLFNCFFLL